MLIPLNSSITKDIAECFNKTSNLKLFYDKYIYNWESNFEFKSKNIQKFLKTFATLENKSIKENYIYFMNNWKNTLSKIQNIRIFEAKNSSNLIVGLGSDTVLENSITLHCTTGVPYIPGSAIKGVVRSYYIDTINNCDGLNPQIIDASISSPEAELTEDTKKNAEIQYGRRIFGTKESRGELIFYDAYPLHLLKLKLDIMNPHYSNYYSNKDNKNPPPGDWENPVPTYFITVDAGQDFIFAFSAIKGQIADKEIDLIRGAILDYGLGAKTSVGYGFFGNLAESKVLKEGLDNQEKVNSMSEIEIKASKIRDPKCYDESEVYRILKNEFESLSEKDKLLLAKAFKERWIIDKKWHGKQSKNQTLKIKRIKDILGE